MGEGESLDKIWQEMMGYLELKGPGAGTPDGLNLLGGFGYFLWQVVQVGWG